MSRASQARAERRRAARAGVAVYDRVIIDRDAIAKAQADDVVSVRDLLAYHVAVAIESLDERGADLTKMIVITIGEHPDYPGDTMIEAKAAALRPDHAPADNCPGCPLDHSLDNLDE